MGSLPSLPFDNSYARLHPAFFEAVHPTPLSNPQLVAVSPSTADLLGLGLEVVRDPDFVRAMAGNGLLPGSEPIAAIYAGHQFGVWVPQLGDGRAILLGEVVGDGGERWDLQLKGAGPTSFSRMGDGRSVLRSAIREFLAGEALHALGVPTTRSLCVVGSDELVYRETPETAATLLRVAPTHVRFGSFQLFASRRQIDRVQELADYVIGLHHPGLAADPDRYIRWFEIVVERTAHLVADWMAVGFAHGVLNTDNMSVLGITIDYGPYGFMDAYDHNFICNHSDHEGRYAFGQQPAIGVWNLARFAESLLSLFTVEQAKQALSNYSAAFEQRYGTHLRAKLGFVTAQDDDPTLVADWLKLLASTRADYTLTWRALAEVGRDDEAVPTGLRGRIDDEPALDAWLNRYRTRLALEQQPDDIRRAQMQRVNPRFVLRNYLAHQAIEQAVAGDFEEVARLLAVLERPFDEQPECSRYAEPPPPWGRELVVSCSS